MVGVEWKLYYGDRSTFSNLDGSWGEAPAWGVAAIAIRDQYVGREIDTPRHPGCGDYYVWTTYSPRPWWVDCGGLMDHLVTVGYMTSDMRVTDVPLDSMLAAGVKFGRTLDNPVWRPLAEWIVADADQTFIEGIGSERPGPPALSG